MLLRVILTLLPPETRNNAPSPSIADTAATAATALTLSSSTALTSFRPKLKSRSCAVFPTPFNAAVFSIRTVSFATNIISEPLKLEFAPMLIFLDNTLISPFALIPPNNKLLAFILVSVFSSIARYLVPFKLTDPVASP